MLFVGGVVTKPAAFVSFENRAPARDILKNASSSNFINIQKLRSRARQFVLFDVLMMFVSSKIAIPLQTSSRFLLFAPMQKGIIQQQNVQPDSSRAHLFATVHEFIDAVVSEVGCVQVDHQAELKKYSSIMS